MLEITELIIYYGLFTTYVFLCCILIYRSNKKNKKE